MIKFTVGPVQTYDYLQDLNTEDIPYFRSKEFSEIILENEQFIKELTDSKDKDSRVVFITSSGTGAMEASTLNLFNKGDKVIVINGGTFGKRFADICEIQGLDVIEIKLDPEEKLTESILNSIDTKNVKGLITSMHETSTGVLFDINLLGKFAHKNNMLFIVDAISSFLADELHFDDAHIDALIMNSQKGLACSPGIAMIELSKNAIDIIENSEVKSYYFNLKKYLKYGKKGQPPFTPATSILNEMNVRFKAIIQNGGIEKQIESVKLLADYFKSRIVNYPFRLINNSTSNAVTSLVALTIDPKVLYEKLKDDYDILISLNRGELKSKIFRIGHLGNLTKKDYDALFDALDDLKEKNIL